MIRNVEDLLRLPSEKEESGGGNNTGGAEAA